MVFPFIVSILILTTVLNEHAAYLMGWLVDKVCGAYHKFKKEEEKDGKEN